MSLTKKCGLQVVLELYEAKGCSSDRKVEDLKEKRMFPKLVSKSIDFHNRSGENVKKSKVQVPEQK